MPCGAPDGRGCAGAAAAALQALRAVGSKTAADRTSPAVPSLGTVLSSLVRPAEGSVCAPGSPLRRVRLRRAHPCALRRGARAAGRRRSGARSAPAGAGGRLPLGAPLPPPRGTGPRARRRAAPRRRIRISCERGIVGRPRAARRREGAAAARESCPHIGSEFGTGKGARAAPLRPAYARDFAAPPRACMISAPLNNPPAPRPRDAARARASLRAPADPFALRAPSTLPLRPPRALRAAACRPPAALCPASHGSAVA